MKQGWLSYTPIISLLSHSFPLSNSTCMWSLSLSSHSFCGNWRRRKKVEVIYGWVPWGAKCPTTWIQQTTSMTDDKCWIDRKRIVLFEEERQIVLASRIHFIIFAPWLVYLFLNLSFPFYHSKGIWKNNFLVNYLGPLRWGLLASRWRKRTSGLWEKSMHPSP